MKIIDEGTMRPSGFESSPVDGPPAPPASTHLARRRRKQLIVGSFAAVAAALIVAVWVGQPLGRQTDAVPARTIAPTNGTISTPIPTPSSTPPADTAPPLRYRAGEGYVDRKGRSMDSIKSGFEATTKNTYTLVRQILDPRRAHLAPYEPGAFTGGGGVSDIQVGQKLGWTNKGDSGQGMLLVSITRPSPGRKPVVNGETAMGLCAGNFADLDSPCTRKIIAGRQVWYAAQSHGGYVIDYVQGDGEIASIINDPLFGNNTTVALRSMKLTPSKAVKLLADPRLDVVG